MTIYCSNCGMALSDDASFCIKCGKPLQGAAQSSPQAEPQWEYCTIESEKQTGDGHLLAKAIGPKGTYTAAVSQGKTSQFSSHAKREAVTNEFINALVAAGWEALPPGGYGSGHRFRRKVTGQARSASAASTTASPGIRSGPVTKKTSTGKGMLIVGFLLAIVICAVVALSQHPSTVGQAQNAVNTPAPTPTFTAIKLGAVLYKADWSNGIAGWKGSPDWQVQNGMLTNNGTANYWNGSIVLPYQPPSPDYAIEAEIQVVKVTSCSSFGVIGRTQDEQGVQAGVNFCKFQGAALWTVYDRTSDNIPATQASDVPNTAFNPGTGWHTYLLELKGKTVVYLIDNKIVATSPWPEGVDPYAGFIEMWSYYTVLNIRSLTIYATK